MIVAQRHVHMSPDAARRFDVADRDTILASLGEPLRVALAQATTPARRAS